MSDIVTLRIVVVITFAFILYILSRDDDMKPPKNQLPPH